GLRRRGDHPGRMRRRCGGRDPVSEAENAPRRHHLADGHLPFAYHDWTASYAHRGQRAAGDISFDLEHAGPPHLEALLDHPPQRAVATRVARREVAGQRRARTARRGIFWDRDSRTEHSRVHVRSRPLATHREDEDILRPRTV